MDDDDKDEESMSLFLTLLQFLSRLISASINRFERKSDIMKSLQDEWSRSAKLKHQREEEERRFLRCVSDGSPLNHSQTLWRLTGIKVVILLGQLNLKSVRATATLFLQHALL